MLETQERHKVEEERKEALEKSLMNMPKEMRRGRSRPQRKGCVNTL